MLATVSSEMALSLVASPVVYDMQWRISFSLEEVPEKFNKTNKQTKMSEDFFSYFLLLWSSFFSASGAGTHFIFGWG